METIFVLLPLALLIAAVAVGFFVWAVRSGQFDDLDTPAVRMLFDEEKPAPRSRDSGAGIQEPRVGGLEDPGPGTRGSTRAPNPES